MSQVINWICLISITFLIMDIMVFFCKDVMCIMKSSIKKKRTNVAKTNVKVNEYVYETKIAK